MMLQIPVCTDVHSYRNYDVTCCLHLEDIAIEVEEGSAVRRNVGKYTLFVSANYSNILGSLNFAIIGNKIYTIRFDNQVN